MLLEYHMRNILLSRYPAMIWAIKSAFDVEFRATIWFLPRRLHARCQVSIGLTMALYSMQPRWSRLAVSRHLKTVWMTKTSQALPHSLSGEKGFEWIISKIWLQVYPYPQKSKIYTLHKFLKYIFTVSQASVNWNAMRSIKSITYIELESLNQFGLTVRHSSHNVISNVGVCKP